MCRILKSSHEHPLTQSLGLIQRITCQTCSMGKLIIKPSYDKIHSNPHIFLQRILGEHLWTDSPFMLGHLGILWFWLTLPHVGHTCACCPQGTLLSPNCWLRLSSSRLTTLIIRSNMLDWIMLENSHLKFFMTIACQLRIEVKHPVPHVHTQNGLADAFIKRLQMIARSLVIRTKLSIVAWAMQYCMQPCWSA